MSALHLIIAPPPTPNGDLHVGHLSGPYLAADIYRRYVIQQGGRAVYVVSTDDNQSYVDTTARRLGTEPEALIQQARRDIQKTLAAYNIGLSHFGQSGPEYTAFVTKFFSALAAKGLVRVEKVPVLFDSSTGAFPVEAFVTGRCPWCLEGTCGGICEGCGHPNSCVDLAGLDRNRYQVRQEERLVLDLEQFRPALDQHLLSMGTHRPALLRLINSLLAGKLKPMVISYETPRGIPADGFGAAGQRLNVWAEMYPGHIYWLTRMAGNDIADARYVQFLGFDNSYFYVFVHVALALAARQTGFNWPLPSAFVTNQFYYLNTGKFSTSKGHVIWARDLAAEHNTDLARLFLALHGPEYQEATFSEEIFRLAVNEFATKINRLAAAFNSRRNSAGPSQAALPAELTAMMSREAPLAEYSSAELARRSIHCLEYLEHLISTDRQAPIACIPGAVALCLGPFCPDYTDQLKARYSIKENTWTNLARCNVHPAMPEIEEQCAHAL